MRFLHISDLHFGKTIHGVSMLENRDQPHWVDRFLALAQELRPDAVLISGDVYDRGAPSGAAVSLLSRLVEGLAALEIWVMMIAGNHDSGQRLSFAGDILEKQKVLIAGTVDRELKHVTLYDEFGPITFWLMPYVFPLAVAQALNDEDIRDFDTAVRRLLAEQPIEPAERNVILAHQNVTAFGAEAVRGGSESTVGGVGQVEFTAFDAFDYAALGHIHAAYSVGRETVRYAGSPMCYHFNEIRQPAKGPLLVELGAKGAPVRIERQQIAPLHQMRELRGAFAELRQSELDRDSRDEYLRLVITDQPMTPEISDFFQSLAQARGSVLMERVSEFRRFTDDVSGADAGSIREKSVEALFADFYIERSGGEEPEARDLELLHQAGELLRSRLPDPGARSAADPETVRALLQFLMREEAEQ